MAAQDFDDVDISTELVGPSIDVIRGSDRNMGTSIGDGGILVVDD